MAGPPPLFTGEGATFQNLPGTCSDKQGPGGDVCSMADEHIS